jgi:hypothetical protein
LNEAAQRRGANSPAREGRDRCPERNLEALKARHKTGKRKGRKDRQGEILDELLGEEKTRKVISKPAFLGALGALGGSFQVGTNPFL